MRAFFKKLIPLALRVRLKQLGHSWLDLRDPITTPRVPSRAMTFIGGGDFVTVGEDFFKTLKRHGLDPTDNVMDVGCGQGRMARPLIDYLDQGHYVGLDIALDGIEWCQKHYAELPNFKFIHMDVYNSRYNPRGSQKAAEYVFPIEDESQDLIFLTSVFTHMLAQDVEAYLYEFNRILKPGGKALISWYLLDDVTRNITHAELDFKYKLDDVSCTTVKSTPEAAIAFDQRYIAELYKKAGFQMIKTEPGSWARPESGFMLQDLIVAVK